MKFYHATTKENMMKIVGEDRIKASWDEVVYLCKEAVDACKFLIVRGIEKMSVIEVDVDESKVQESFDRSVAFFQCKAYMHNGDIKLTGSEAVWDYDFDFSKEEA